MEKIEKFFTLLRSALVTLMYLMVSIFILNYWSEITTLLKDFATNAKMTEANIGGVKFQLLKEEKKTIEVALNQDLPQKGTGDSVAKDYQVTLSKRLSVINQQLDVIEKSSDTKNVITNRQKWVYVGSYNKTANRWDTKNINFENEITIGSQGTTNVPLNVRSNFPIYDQTNGWVLAEVIDAVNKNQPIKVANIQIIPGTNNRELYWIQLH